MIEESEQLRRKKELPQRSHSKAKEDMNVCVTAQVEVRREEKDKVDFNITEQQKGEGKGVEKEVIKVIQTSKRLVREFAERKRCMVIHEALWPSG